VRKVFSFGFTLTLWLFLSYIVNIADRFIIKTYSNYAEVGVYSAIKDFVIKISTFATAPIILAYHPQIVREWNNDNRKESFHLISEALKLILVVFAAVFIAFILLKDIFYVRILHLSIQVPAALSVAIFCSAFIWQAAMIIHKPLELLLKQNLMIIGIGASLAVNIIANFLLVPRYGLIAAAFVSLGSVLVYITIVLIFILRNLSRRKSQPVDE
jgi:O-antigen/teichoic acid export membrane protein